ncbi:hypothetical protein [Lentzea sp. NBRC 102530]|uniref:hypothetical protein n=1 Tax=Lentzea sp. NBRC 102530 TaxID=3032201 RepID=UPI00249FF6FF|nr:hypothetical protein [Lentzea sp. NBRC 102530]GLY51965.1 hypothetical protein Lesp01_56210 [Lentzea sp. NBRC 102530]
MVLRTVVGAVAGAVAGTGFFLTLDGFSRYCYLRPGRTGCGVTLPLLHPPVFAFWMVVAAAVILAGFRVGRQERGWVATGIGSGLWLVLIVAVVWFEIGCLEVHPEDRHLVLGVTAVVVPCVAYAVATSSAGQARRC